MTGVVAGPPTQLNITARNAEYGLYKVGTLTAVNCTVAPVTPLPCHGTCEPVALTATKTDQTKSAQIVLSLFSPEETCSCSKDPIFTTIKLATGTWSRQTFAGIAATDHYLTVTNLNPGLERLDIRVNNKYFRMNNLRENETRSLDLKPGLTAAENTITFIGYGQIGAAANIVVLDTAPAKDPGSGGVAAVRVEGLGTRQGVVHRLTPVWGGLSEYTEENSDLQTVDAARQTVRLNFNGALHRDAASDPSIFTVEVNRKPVLVQAVNMRSAVTGGMEMTLQLPPGALHSGDSVDLFWQGLRDGRGRGISGHVPLYVR